MAITINRNNEITPEEFAKLKEKFQEQTQSKAIYACVKYVIYNHKENHLKEIDKLEKELKELKTKYKKFIKTVKKKFIIDNEFDKFVFDDEDEETED